MQLLRQRRAVLCKLEEKSWIKIGNTKIRMLNFISFILSLTSLIHTNNIEKPKCYCLNSDSTNSAMINNCIQFTNDEKFIYFWHSDLITIEETGYWSKLNETVTINSFDSYHDYFKVMRTKKVKEVKIDSVEVNIFYKESRSIASYFGVNNNTLDLTYYTDSTNIVRLPSDTISEYKISNLFTPHQFSFKIEPNDTNIEIEVTPTQKLHRIFFVNERLQLKENKLLWLDRYKNPIENYWTKVTIKKFNRIQQKNSKR